MLPLDRNRYRKIAAGVNMEIDYFARACVKQTVFAFPWLLRPVQNAEGACLPLPLPPCPNTNTISWFMCVGTSCNLSAHKVGITKARAFLQK